MAWECRRTDDDGWLYNWVQDSKEFNEFINKIGLEAFRSVKVRRRS